MRGRVLTILAVAALLAAAAFTAAAQAAKPESERIEVDETFTDDFLSDACGVTVTTSAKGHLILRTFTRAGAGVTELTTINIGLTATANGNTYRFRDVGADHLQVKPDGSIVLSIIGQIPFGFTGVLKLDPATGEAILEPQHDISDRVDKACAVLTA